MDQLPLINWILVEDETLLDTEHVKIPPILPESLRVCVYFPVTGLSNSLSVSSVTVVRSLYQVTVVASRSTSGNTCEGELRGSCS